MKLPPLVLAFPLLLVSCSNDPVAQDIKAYDKVANMIINTGAGQMQSQLLNATTNDTRAKILGDYADAMSNEATVLGAYPAKTPEVKAISGKIAAAMKKAADGARSQQSVIAGAASDADGKIAAKAAIRENEAVTKELIAAFVEFNQLANKHKVDVNIL